MPLFLAAEIVDAIARHLGIPGGTDDGTEDDMTKDDLKSFRLVCEEFAAAGIRYLVPTISVMRVPQAFEVANRVAEHPVARLYVRKLTYYYDSVRIKDHGRHANALAIAAYQMNEFQQSGEDLVCLVKLLKAFTCLKRFEFRVLDYDARNADWFRYTKKISHKLGFDYLLRSPATSPSLEFLCHLHINAAFEALVLCKTVYAHCIRSSPACFLHLRVLDITSPFCKDTPAPTNIREWSPLLEELGYVGVRRRAATQDEVVSGLPPTLKILRLEHVELVGQSSFPNGLHILELSDVLFEPPNEMPSALSAVRLGDLQLLNTKLSTWVDVLTSLRSGCIFTVTGCFRTIERGPQIDGLSDRKNENQNQIKYLDCGDSASGIDVGVMLGKILCSTGAANGGKPSKEELLRLLFSEDEGLIPTGHRRDARHLPMHRDLKVSACLESALKQQTCDLPDVSAFETNVKGPYRCAVCPLSHCYTYTGVIG